MDFGNLCIILLVYLVQKQFFNSFILKLTLNRIKDDSNLLKFFLNIYFTRKLDCEVFVCQYFSY